MEGGWGGVVVHLQPAFQPPLTTGRNIRLPSSDSWKVQSPPSVILGYVQTVSFEKLQPLLQY